MTVVEYMRIDRDRYMHTGGRLLLLLLLPVWVLLLWCPGRKNPLYIGSNPGGDHLTEEKSGGRQEQTREIMGKGRKKKIGITG